MKVPCAIVGFLSLFGLVSARGAAPAPAASGSPVDKVVELLNELKARIETDGTSEQKAFDKYACWCEQTSDRKAQSITAVKAELQSLGNTILELRGTIATLSTEIQELTAEIKANEEAQQQATSLRQKENANFVAEKAEMQQAIAALEKAMHVLTAATGGDASSLVQKVALENVKAAIQHASPVSKVGPRQLSALQRLISDTHTSYTPQSSTIQGILSDMYATFASNLESATQNEARKQRSFEAFIATKQQELASLQAEVVRKERAKAEAEIQLTDATQSYADSEKQLAADIEFFDAVKEACTTKAEEWSERSKMRTAELAGIEEALTILTSDEAKETFGKSIKPGFATPAFIQVSEESDSPTAASKAFKALQQHARQAHSIRLAAIAANLRTQSGAVGHFDEVIEAIDNLIASLVDEQAQDDKQVDECKTQLHDIDLSVDDLNWKIKNNEAAIQKFETVIAAKEAEKATTIEEIEKTQKDIQDMEAARTEENGQFLQAKADDEKAIELLKQAKEAIAKYYEENDIELGPLQLLQAAAPSPATPIDSLDAAPDARFSGKGSRKTESKGIISILTLLIEDLEKEIVVGQQGEEAAQLAYEKQLATAKSLEEDLTTKKTNLEDTIASQNGEKQREEGLLTDNKDELKNQEDTEANLKPHCDFMTTHQETRREKRATEMEGLKQAKAFLAGAGKDSLLETSPRFDDSAFSSISFKAVSFLQRRM